MNPDQNQLSDASKVEDREHPFENEIDERLRSAKSPSDRRTLASLLGGRSVICRLTTRAPRWKQSRQSQEWLCAPAGFDVN
jgi:hypothetical protein